MNSTNSKKRICFISYRSYPLFNPHASGSFGGAEVDLYLTAVELAKDNQFEISFVVGDYGQPDIEHIHNVKLIKSINDEKNLFLQAPKIWKALKHAEADMYFSECLSLGIVIHALFCSIKKKIYIYRTASSNDCDGQYFRQHPCRALPVKWALNKARRIVTQNQTDAKNLLKTIGRHAVVIRNAAVIPELNDKSDSTILWIGRSDPVKQPDLFIDLAMSMPHQQFTMICQKNLHDPYYDRLCDRAEKVPNLQFIPGVPYSQVDSFFQKTKYLVNTSVSEGFPNVFVQACLHAVPVLSLNANPDNFLNEYNCGLCAGGDENLFRNMAKQLLDYDLTNKMGMNAREYVINNHNISNIILQYKTLLSSL